MVDRAKRFVAADSPSEDREALVCAVEAIEKLAQKIDGLADGSIAFDGQIHAPKGFVMSKPSVQESR